MHTHTNHLISETSPYLLQHAHNPVNWYPWGEEALEKARKENKPILVSIGYSACHWCHVMERESFEDEGTAEMMNDHFVNIKIDREERPDLDHIYMDAVQTMAGSGGWPLNVFLTPEAKPFYGGTYFPPQRAFNRPSWKEILLGVSQAFKERRNEIDSQADNLTSHLVQSNSFGQEKISGNDVADTLLTKKNIDNAFQNVMKTADKELGGFGRAPKFPQTFTIQFLLRYHWLTKNEDALQQALLSLDKMIGGGIYDQVGGGFARYSTDAEWLAPHFEKMLYDNALLISALSEAYQLTNKKRYKEVIKETIGFVKRELFHDDGGFYSALDADSDGEEGKFYVWEYKEVVEILHEDAVLFCEYFDITPTGNWEGKSIPRISESSESFAQKKSIPVDHLIEILERGKSKLRDRRNERIRPNLDDKIILGWNALMNRACSMAYAATGNNDYRQLAELNMRFILEKFKTESDNEFHHNWKNGAGKNPAFLDDYAFLIQALISFHEITSDTKWLVKAKELTDFVIRNFSEEETGFFYFTHRQQKDVIMRKKEVYDGAVPSGNAVMANNLHHLSIFFDKSEWRERAQNMTTSLGGVITRYPGSFGIWASFLQEIIYGTHEIAVVGKNFEAVVKDILVAFIPHKVLIASDRENKHFPLLAGKSSIETTKIWLCKNFSCLAPFFSVKDLMWEIKAESP